MAPKVEFTQGVPTLGGAIWIDLLNSRFALPTGVVDLLAEDDSFARWTAAVGLAGTPDGHDDRQALAALRATLERAFDAICRGELPPRQSLSAVNNILEHRTTHSAIAVEDGNLVMARTVKDHGSRIALTIAEDFAVLATTGEAKRFKRCENPACSLVFYDRGRNNRRRWCSTSVCGNRDKVARYRARKAGKDPR